MLRGGSKLSIHFRDDLSEHSSPSNWGDKAGPLSLADYRLVSDGLQARRTAGEATLRARWRRRKEADADACGLVCKCFGNRAARACVEVFRGDFQKRPLMMFSWNEVQSIILLPCENEQKGIFLIAVSSFRIREYGPKEFIFQAGSMRSRARSAVEMMAAILKDRSCGDTQSVASVVGRPKCCGAGRTLPLPTVLFMDMMRIACEAARLRPSVAGIARLVEILELLSDSQWPGFKTAGLSGGVGDIIIGSQHDAVPHFPLVALRRFAEAARRAQEILEEWIRWQQVCKLIRPECQGLDSELWRSRIMPFLCPRDPSSLQLADDFELNYPATVDSQLATAAERCRRTLS
ncbi:unnamed protein product [Polarella glacialis]|uniref:Uncharacterized protein n=1 Tax=Polarella glacialis TaxID=89957 RepID=A0A813FVD0_POLGL|nr:unnamed protein product [Polarella glacialis]|mmetsp:Transcript_51907/g.93468  ORF Transcript_51907/g.93468 Transcript_51907/m.93468 type:complete len:348 (-) Transcript_51907:348-1391(-)